MSGDSHEFVQEWSAESPYCGAMVMRNGGGDTCGLLRDDPAHKGRTTSWPRWVFWLPGLLVIVGTVVEVAR